MTDYTPTITTFFETMTAGTLSPDLFTADATAFTSTSGRMELTTYLGAGQLLRALFKDGLQFSQGTTTSQDNRVAIEVKSHGIFHDETAYENEYLFYFVFEDGKIARVVEHFNTRPVTEALVPRIQEFMSKRQG